jgi:hypothetical protein
MPHWASISKTLLENEYPTRRAWRCQRTGPVEVHGFWVLWASGTVSDFAPRLQRAKATALGRRALVPNGKEDPGCEERNQYCEAQ